MRTDLTIDKVTAFVNGKGPEKYTCDGPEGPVRDIFMAEAEEKALLKKYGVKFPVARSTVYSWMLRAGASCEEAGQCYYTDKHNSPEVVEYHNKVPIPLRASPQIRPTPALTWGC